MTTQQRWLIGFYVLIAIAALAATWSQNLAYFGGGQGNALLTFLLETKVNPASRSITVDIGFFLLTASALMIIEARRLGVRFVWLYILLGFLVAISVTFPLFLIARELRIAEAPQARSAWSLKLIDVAGIGLVSVIVIGLTFVVLT